VRKAILLIMLLTAVLFLPGCGDGKKIKPKLPVGDKIEDIPNFVMEGFKFSSAQKGVRNWQIDGRGAQIFEMKKKIYIQDFTMTSFEAKGKKSVLTGDKAVINSDTNFMEVDDHVKFRASNGMVLKTQKLFWDDKLRKMYTDVEVVIIKDGSVLKGIGFESDADMKNMVIKKKVKLTAKDIKEAESE
jgi:LPS export ABC transporter protein LptC